MSPQADTAQIPGLLPAETVRFRFAGAQVDAFFDLNEPEHDRRTRAGIPALLDRCLLDVLAELPHGEHVPWSVIDPVKQPVLDSAPPGIVRTDQYVIMRTWRPAIELKAVARRVRTWRRDMHAVSLFAPDAPRYLIVATARGPQHPMLVRARMLGVGVVMDNGSSSRVLVPAQRLPVSPTARHWRLLETVYDTWLRRKEIQEADVA